MFERFDRKPDVDPKPGIAVTGWQTGLAVTESVNWRQSRNPDLYNRERSLTWARYPYRYWLTDAERDANEALGNNKARILWLRRISYAKAEAGLVELTDFYAVDSQLIGVIKLQVPRVDEKMSAEEESTFEENVDFSIESGLFRPNSEEEQEFSTALQQAYLDGANEYVRP